MMSFKDFQRAAERVRVQYNMMQQNNMASYNNSIFVRSDYKWIHIKTASIRYIQGMGDYLSISLTDNPELLVTYATFAGIKSILPANFKQVHRSWIVNMEQIKEIGSNKIIMDNDTLVPIGNSYKELLINYLQGISVGKSSR